MTSQTLMILLDSAQRTLGQEIVASGRGIILSMLIMTGLFYGYYRSARFKLTTEVGGRQFIDELNKFASTDNCSQLGKSLCRHYQSHPAQDAFSTFVAFIQGVDISVLHNLEMFCYCFPVPQDKKHLKRFIKLITKYVEREEYRMVKAAQKIH